MSVSIRFATQVDHPSIWKIIEPMIRAGETYTLPRDMEENDALTYWLSPNHEVFVAQAEDEGEIAGTYFLQANQQGAGSHIANCGYVSAPWARGRGIARAMCLHSLERAKARGFRAMQFNFVVSSNEHALRLWKDLGFTVVGEIPQAFEHPTLGFVPAYVMYRRL
jgi:ribosomal protein S18 acetylase RimI-like enzyme